MVPIKIYDKRANFDFDIVNFSFLDGNSPSVPHMGYIYLNVLDSPELLQYSDLKPPLVYSTGRSKAVVQVLVLLFVAFRFILRGDLFYVLPCVILFLCFSVLLALRLPRLGKKELILVLVRFVLVWFCRFSLPLGVWEGLRFVIVALPLPGLFS